MILQRIKLAFEDKGCPSFKNIKKLGGKKIDAFFNSLPKECVCLMSSDAILEVFKDFGAKETLARLRLSL